MRRNRSDVLRCPLGTAAVAPDHNHPSMRIRWRRLLRFDTDVDGFHRGTHP